MKLYHLIFPVLALMLGACTTYSAQNVSNVELEEEVVEVDVHEAKEGVDLDRMICKRTVITGSRFTKKVCMTWGEWRAQVEDAKNFTSTSQGRSRTRTDPDEGG